MYSEWLTITQTNWSYLYMNESNRQEKNQNNKDEKQTFCSSHLKFIFRMQSLSRYSSGRISSSKKNIVNFRIIIWQIEKRSFLSAVYPGHEGEFQKANEHKKLFKYLYKKFLITFFCHFVCF